MSDKNGGPEKPPAGEPSTQRPPATEPTAADAAAKAEAPRPDPAAEAVALLKQEAADLKDRLLRAHAEMENLRRRTEREKADTAKYAISKFAKDVVSVSDNVRRALDLTSTMNLDANEELKRFVEGVSVTERELINALERNGIKRVDPVGSPFDPNQHQAVMEVEDASVPAGTVAQVFQAGYLIEDRVLRPAMVVVAKGGPKPGPAEPPPAPPGEGPST